MTEHVEKNRINNDLRYRFEYLSKFLNFTSDDVKILNSLAPIIFPRIPVIADTVYRKLFSFDITKQYFVVRNHGFENFTVNHDRGNVTLDSEQMIFRKDMLSLYLKRVFTQREWNDTFLQYLCQIGKLHTNRAGSSSINVDYIHINALLGYLEHLIIEILLTINLDDSKTRYNMIATINKLFWIQNDFFTMNFMNTMHTDSPSVDTADKNATACCFF